MKLSLDQVRERLVAARLMRSYVRPQDGVVGYASDDVMLGIAEHDGDGTPISFILYPRKPDGLHKALMRQRVQAIRDLFADAENVEVEKPIGRIVAA